MDNVLIINDCVRKKYSRWGEFSEGLAWVQDHIGLYGYVNQEGEEVIPCQYGSANDFHDGLAFVFSSTSDQRFFIDQKGKVKIKVAKKIISVSNFHDGLVRIQSKNRLFGYMNQEGKVVISCQYDEATDFENGFAVACLNKFDGGLYLIDTFGTVKKRIQCATMNSKNSLRNGIVPIAVKTGLAFMDTFGQIYSSRTEIEQLGRYYSAVNPSFLHQTQFDIGSLEHYYSEIIFNRNSMGVVADSKEELGKKKKEILEYLKKDVLSSLSAIDKEIEILSIDQSKQKVKV